jgi:hypothetical protein
MPTFAEIADDVGGSHLHSLFDDEPEPQPEPEVPESEPRVVREGDRFVVRLVQKGRSEGLLSNKVMTKSEAEELARNHNRATAPGRPEATVHNISV